MDLGLGNGCCVFVKETRGVIDDAYLPINAMATSLSNIIPIKVNIFFGELY